MDTYLQPLTTRPSLLIRLRQAEDAEAWSQFVELYAPLLFGFFRNRGLQNADAADLTQDVLQGVAVGVQSLKYDGSKGSFRSWLFGIARNKLSDFLSAQSRGKVVSGDSEVQAKLLQVAATDEETARWDRDYEQRLFAWAAEQVQQQVDEKTWRAFVQTAVENQSGNDVARNLGMTVGAVYVAKSRVIARMKQCVLDIQGDQT